MCGGNLLHNLVRYINRQLQPVRFRHLLHGLGCYINSHLPPDHWLSSGLPTTEHNVGSGHGVIVDLSVKAGEAEREVGRDGALRRRDDCHHVLIARVVVVTDGSRGAAPRHRGLAESHTE